MKKPLLPKDQDLIAAYEELKALILSTQFEDKEAGLKAKDVRELARVLPHVCLQTEQCPSRDELVVLTQVMARSPYLLSFEPEALIIFYSTWSYPDPLPEDLYRRLFQGLSRRMLDSEIKAHLKIVLTLLFNETCHGISPELFLTFIKEICINYPNLVDLTHYPSSDFFQNRLLSQIEQLFDNPADAKYPKEAREVLWQLSSRGFPFSNSIIEARSERHNGILFGLYAGPKRLLGCAPDVIAKKLYYRHEFTGDNKAKDGSGLTVRSQARLDSIKQFIQQNNPKEINKKEINFQLESILPKVLIQIICDYAEINEEKVYNRMRLLYFLHITYDNYFVIKKIDSDEKLQVTYESNDTLLYPKSPKRGFLPEFFSFNTEQLYQAYCFVLMCDLYHRDREIFVNYFQLLLNFTFREEIEEYFNEKITGQKIKQYIEIGLSYLKYIDDKCVKQVEKDSKFGQRNKSTEEWRSRYLLQEFANGLPITNLRTQTYLPESKVLALIRKNGGFWEKPPVVCKVEKEYKIFDQVRKIMPAEAKCQIRGDLCVVIVQGVPLERITEVIKILRKTFPDLRVAANFKESDSGPSAYIEISTEPLMPLVKPG